MVQVVKLCINVVVAEKITLLMLQLFVLMVAGLVF